MVVCTMALILLWFQRDLADLGHVSWTMLTMLFRDVLQPVFHVSAAQNTHTITYTNQIIKTYSCSLVETINRTLLKCARCCTSLQAASSGSSHLAARFMAIFWGPDLWMELVEGLIRQCRWVKWCPLNDQTESLVDRLRVTLFGPRGNLGVWHLRSINGWIYTYIYIHTWTSICTRKKYHELKSWRFNNFDDVSQKSGRLPKK